LIEVRGLGIRQVPYEPVAVIGAVVELDAADARRLPEPSGGQIEIAGIKLSRLAVAAGIEPLRFVLAYLKTDDAIA